MVSSILKIPHVLLKGIIYINKMRHGNVITIFFLRWWRRLLTNLDELSFLSVFALPKATSKHTHYIIIICGTTTRTSCFIYCHLHEIRNVNILLLLEFYTSKVLGYCYKTFDKRKEIPAMEHSKEHIFYYTGWHKEE